MITRKKNEKRKTTTSVRKKKKGKAMPLAAKPNNVPVYNSNFAPALGEATKIVIRDGYAGVVIAEVFEQDEITGTVLRIAFYANLGSQPMSYTRTVGDPVYAVDLPRVNEINLDSILTAIVNGAPGKPPPPVRWG